MACPSMQETPWRVPNRWLSPSTKCSGRHAGKHLFTPFPSKSTPFPLGHYMVLYRRRPRRGKALPPVRLLLTRKPVSRLLPPNTKRTWTLQLWKFFDGEDSQGSMWVNTALYAEVLSLLRKCLKLHRVQRHYQASCSLMLWGGAHHSSFLTKHGGL